MSIGCKFLSGRPVSNISTYESPIISAMLDPPAQEGYVNGCASFIRVRLSFWCVFCNAPPDVTWTLCRQAFSEEVVLYPTLGSCGDAVSPRWGMSKAVRGPAKIGMRKFPWIPWDFLYPQDSVLSPSWLAWLSTLRAQHLDLCSLTKTTFTELMEGNGSPCPWILHLMACWKSAALS